MKKFLFGLLLVAATLSCAPEQGIPADKKEIMDRFIAGTLDESYVPAAFFTHFPGKTQGDAAVAAHMEYYINSGNDIFKIQFEQTLPKVPDLDTPEGWENFEPVPEDFYRPTVEIVKRLYDIAGKNVYVLPSIYNAPQVAHHSLGEAGLKIGAKEHPEALKKILDNYQQALLWYARECKAFGIEGFYMCTQGGEKLYYDAPDFFEKFTKPYDMELMTECCEGTKCNILHICDWEGPYEEMTRYKDYPGQIINTPFNMDGTYFSLQDCVEIFGRPVLGGLNRKGEINTLPADGIKALVDSVLNAAPKGMTMLGAECTVGNAPRENIAAAIAAAHKRK